MIDRWLVSAVLIACGLSSCKLESSRAGESCKRTTQCEAGLACVRGKCSKDLKAIAGESTVPDLGMGMGETAVAGNEAGVVPAGGGEPAAGSGGM